MATLAQTLERTKPEFVDVAVMRLNVIADCCRGDDASLRAILTQRMFAQLVPPDPSPPSRGVPLIPFCRLAANSHGSNLSSAGRSTKHWSSPHMRRRNLETGERTHPDATHVWTASRLIGKVMASGLQVLFGEFAKLDSYVRPALGVILIKAASASSLLPKADSKLAKLTLTNREIRCGLSRRNL